MSIDNISSNESEGAFNEFMDEQMDNLVQNILNEGNLTNFGERGSDIIVEMDDIVVPTFVYENEAEGGAGQGAGGPGSGKGGGKLRFNLPFQKLMELIAEKLKLPNLTKSSRGKIKELSHEFKTFGPVGVLLDKKRTFRKALKTSVGTGVYNPAEGKYNLEFRRRDKRFKQPERVEKPKFSAVVFYMGDISYSTYGERLELEKRLVNFIQNWLDFNYGAGKVEHRFFVHDSEAYEVQADEFYNISNVGGTEASIVFQLVHQVAMNEYDPSSTNYYAFYFGDGELFDADAAAIVELLESSMRPVFNRIGVVEVKPGRMSLLNRQISTQFHKDDVVRLGEINSKSDTVTVIKTLFEAR
ncbi:MAG: DUF444 family protein [SAR324 cluster bacterium]|nr:DUF444 family protein [SAR324 cluster bacterium]MBF0351642.1 DUF444 family protein [SAR324 cluster bacterium]